MRYEIWLHTTRKNPVKTGDKIVYEQRTDERYWKDAGTDRERAHAERDRLAALFTMHPGAFVVVPRPDLAGDEETEMVTAPVEKVGEGTR